MALPGLIMPPGLIAGGSVGLTEIISVTAHGDETFPSGIFAGDLLLHWQHCSTTGGVAHAVPSGFEVIPGASTMNLSNARAVPSFKIATGSETGTIGGMSGTNHNFRILLKVRCNAPVTSLEWPEFSNGSMTDNNPSPRDILTSGVPAPFVAVGFYATSLPSADINTRTFRTDGVADDQRDGEAAGTNNKIWAAWKICNSPIAYNLEVDMADQGAYNAVFGTYIQLA